MLPSYREAKFKIKKIRLKERRDVMEVVHEWATIFGEREWERCAGRDPRILIKSKRDKCGKNEN